MGCRRWSSRVALGVSAVAAVLVLSACTSGGQGAVTVTSQVTIPGGSGPVSSGSGPTGAGAASSGPGRPGSAPGSESSPSAGPTSGRNAAQGRSTGTGRVVLTEPDGLKITELKPGEKPPQFVVFSFDGVGFAEKWQYWFGIGDQVPFHFTGFLSGTYLLSDQTKTRYQGPGHGAGKSSIGWDTAADIPVEIGNLNAALLAGEEIGSHFNGHFCQDNAPGGDDWDTADWNNELDQFFGLVKNVDANNGISVALNLPAGEIKGERTPCLTGHKEDLYPALEAHGMAYDSSFTRTGLSWPTKSSDGKIWEIGMSQFPMHGTGHTQITMDYNFLAQQEDSKTTGESPAQSKIDSAQVLATYQDMLKAATSSGIHEPLILGNHFEDWNNDAYSDALANFALGACGRTNVYCVPFRDLIDWMQAQDPAVLAALQNHKSNLGGCPYLAWPHCDGKIQY